jgi:hypothetical protein
MESAIDDEITSINSIYGDDTLILVSKAPVISTLRLPSHSAIVLRLEFPVDYPDAPPAVLGTETVGEHAPKGVGTRVVEMSRDVLGRIYRPGEACIYDFIEEIGEALRDSDYESETKEHERLEERTKGSHESGIIPPASLGPDPPWTMSSVFTEKKSVFIARVATVTSPTHARQFLQHLITTDKKVAKATHNITSWRIHGEHGVTYQDCDDDGEDAAGGRLLHLMQLMDIWDVMVVVSRWYGGIKLGPDRFRIINSAARDALVQGGFTKEGDGQMKKKGGKKSMH